MYVNMEGEIIDNVEAIRCLINIYMIKKLKRLYKPVNQEKFIEHVRKEFKEKKINYTTKSILFTWKRLLDDYQYYKKNFTTDDARKEWKYFHLMDNCFDDSKQFSEKFKDSRWTLCLISSVSKHKFTVLRYGLTTSVLQSVEDDFQKSGNYDINQKDIYNQWISLKRFYRQNKRTGYYKFDKSHKNYLYYNALKDFYETDISLEYSEYKIDPPMTREDVYQNELVSAIESIQPRNESNEMNEKEVDNSESFKKTSKSVYLHHNLTSNDSSEYMPFTVVMHDILLQFLKKNRTTIRTLNGEIDDQTLNGALEEFQKLGYNVSKKSICNEWNDLTYRYELIKNTECPQKWPYYSDVNYIYSTDTEEVIEDEANSDYTENLILENVRKTQNIPNKDAEINERLLNIYESNNKELLEIKDILIERNLLREEANYLLNIFVEKKNKKIQ